MASGIVLIWYGIASKLFDRTAGLVAAFLTTTGFAYTYYAHTSNLDLSYPFWTSLALHSAGAKRH
jgi:4-amino-4-deoxy-L-arabinose transferase-like glycosyltransferase